MSLLPYKNPLVREYASSSFQAATRRWEQRIRALAARSPKRCLSHRPWIHFHEFGKVRSWQPKLYVCVEAAGYWPLVASLLQRFHGGGLWWKFMLGKGDYRRPDKIVFYPRSTSHLKALIRRVRPLMAGLSCHGLRHAAPTVALGLEPSGHEGIYVGCDPIFLGRASWRVYRSLAMAWAGYNREYLESLPGGPSLWMRRMNLSTSHEGPASLTPRQSDIPYVRRYWKIITST